MITLALPALRLRLPHVPLAAAGVCVALLAGTALRTVWVRDMEYKGDEVWTFERTQRAGVDEPVPTLGMPTSCEVRHPGGTVWVFLALAEVFGVTSPTGLGRACQVVNALAIALVVWFAYRCVPGRDREPWLWAAVLAAVNPLAVVFHRKIWPPSIAPVFVTLALVAWWHRDRRAGAFLWGLASVLVGQVHPAGLFLALGFAGWTFLMDRRNVRWGYWAAGCAVATLTLVPWLLYALAETDRNPISRRSWTNVVNAQFWVHWVTEPIGVSLRYSLGKDFWDYLQQPVVGGVPTFALAAVNLLMIGTGLVILGRGLRRARRAGWRETAANLSGRGSSTALAVAAGLWGFGLAFTLTRLPVHRHYLCLAFPLMYLWLARVALGPSAPPRPGPEGPPPPPAVGRALLLAACLLQFAASAGFLAYVHASPRPIRGDYGTPYRLQADFGLPER